MASKWVKTVLESQTGAGCGNGFMWYESEETLIIRAHLVCGEPDQKVGQGRGFSPVTERDGQLLFKCRATLAPLTLVEPSIPDGR